MPAGATAATRSTGSNTIADLISLAAERYGDAVAARRKVDGAWRDVTYAEVGDRPRRPRGSGSLRLHRGLLPNARQERDSMWLRAAGAAGVRRAQAVARVACVLCAA